MIEELESVGLTINMPKRGLMHFDNQPRSFDVVPPLGGFTAAQPPEGGTTRPLQ
jgi:hypothetical protein